MAMQLALRPLGGCVLCSSGLDGRARAAMTEMVAALGGRYVQDLSKSVTHLVVGPAGVASEKHRAAERAGIHCVSERWVAKCKESMRLERADQYEIHYYLVGLVICVTGDDVSSEHRAGIASLVEQGGGRFEAALEGGVCTHLIASESRGKKWEFAMDHGISIVSREWLLDCVRLGVRVPEDDYRVMRPVLAPRAVDIAASAFFPQEPRVANSADAGPANRASVVLDVVAEFESLRERVYDATNHDAGHKLQLNVFEDHLFYISGFPDDLKDRVLGMVFFGGGQRHLCLVPAVTAVFLGDRTDLVTAQAIRLHPAAARCLKVAWLLHVLKPKMLAFLDRTIKMPLKSPRETFPRLTNSKKICVREGPVLSEDMSDLDEASLLQIICTEMS